MYVNMCEWVCAYRRGSGDEVARREDSERDWRGGGGGGMGGMGGMGGGGST